jgi:hypothetical protein
MDVALPTGNHHRDERCQVGAGAFVEDRTLGENCAVGIHQLDAQASIHSDDMGHVAGPGRRNWR